MKPFDYIAHAVLTDVGRKRKNNEDAYAVFPGHGFFCVADGMGGAEDGEVASGAARDGLEKCFAAFPPERPLSLGAKAAWIERTLNDVSAWIFNRSKDLGNSGTGTTFAGVCFDPAAPGSALALHAGDSRVYLLRHEGERAGTPGSLSQITVDHSVANSAGIDDERKLNPLFRNMIVRGVGLAPSVALERTPFRVAEGDWVVVCTDGLDKMVPDRMIAATLAGAATPEGAVKALVKAALDAGGKDNVTVAALRVGALPAPLPQDALETAEPEKRAPAEDDGMTPSTGSTGGSGTPVMQTPPLSPGGRPGGNRRALVYVGIGVVLAALLGLAARAVLNRIAPPPPARTVRAADAPQEKESPEAARIRRMAEQNAGGEP